MANRITSLFNIKYPIIQAGMIWNSGWKLASAASNSGILGLIGAGSMYPNVLREHIQKCKTATDKPFGVNVPMLYPNIEEIMNIIAEEDVKIVFTSAGNPKTWTKWLQDQGITVVHVVSSVKFALKAQAAGVDAVVALAVVRRVTTLIVWRLVIHAQSPIQRSAGVRPDHLWHR